MGDVGDEFSEEDLVAKVTDLYYKSVLLTKNIFIPNTGYHSETKPKHHKNFCLSIKVTEKTDLWKLFLSWALKKLSILFKFICVKGNM